MFEWTEINFVVPEYECKVCNIIITIVDDDDDDGTKNKVH